MCFVWISEQTAIISLYNIKWLVFITEMECGYCAVRTVYLNITRFSFVLNGLVMAQAVGRRPLKRRTTFNPSQSMWDLRWKKLNCGIFPSQYLSFPLKTSFQGCSILIFINKCHLTEGQQEKPGNLEKSHTDSEIWEHCL